jgi:hypothetical protein
MVSEVNSELDQCSSSNPWKIEVAVFGTALYFSFFVIYAILHGFCSKFFYFFAEMGGNGERV